MVEIDLTEVKACEVDPVNATVNHTVQLVEIAPNKEIVVKRCYVEKLVLTQYCGMIGKASAIGKNLFHSYF